MTELILFTTSGCHLCEQAQQMIQHVLGQPASEVEIAEDAYLLECYGTRIPVLRRMDIGMEIGWPFDEKAILGLLEQEDADS